MKICKKIKEGIKKHKVAIAVGAGALIGVCVGVKYGKHKQNNLFTKDFDEIITVVDSARRMHGNKVNMAYGYDVPPIHVRDMGKLGESAIAGGILPDDAYTHFIMIGKSHK